MSEGDAKGVDDISAGGLSMAYPHAGHRDRLRARARASGFAGMPDYELLELVLFSLVPRKDTKALAKALLARFGSLGAVFAASEPEIRSVTVTGSRGEKVSLGEDGALGLLAMHEALLRIGREPVRKRTVIGSWSSLLAYVRTALAHEPREQFRVLFLDTKNQLILDEIMNRGTVDHAPVYPREVMRRALELSARAVILVHNHPSGDPKPSRADIDMTREVVKAGEPLKISVHDHLVVGREGVSSFRALGLL